MKRVVALLLMSTFSLMFLAISQESGSKPVKTSNLRLTQIAGLELFNLKNCGDCHTLASAAEGELKPVPNKRDDDWFQSHVVENSEIVLKQEKKKRRRRKVLAAEIAAITDFLFESSAEEKKQITDLPENVRAGAYLGYQNNCLGCHTIAENGKEIGPALTNVADNHTEKEWHVKHLKNPKEFEPESTMPAFGERLSDEQIGKIVDYLLTLKK